MGNDAPSDEHLVLAVERDRDTMAFAELHRRYERPVLGLARRLCGADTAEDVAQEVFLLLWRHPEKFDRARGHLRAFLLAQTYGRSIDRLRSDGARAQRQLRVVAGADRLDADPFGAIDAHDVAERVRAALAALPRCQSEPIVLAFYGHLSYREVAEATGEAEGTVKSRIRRGLVSLRTRLVDDWADSA